MNIIATTNGGFLIQATDQEVKDILTAVLGTVDMKNVTVGTKIPAIDYASTITKAKNLKNSYEVRTLKDRIASFNADAELLFKTIDSVPDSL